MCSDIEDTPVVQEGMKVRENGRVNGTKLLWSTVRHFTRYHSKSTVP